MILVNNYTLVKYKVIDASARFFVLERLDPPESVQKDRMSYQEELVCVRPDQLMHDFHLEGDSVFDCISPEN